MHKIVAERLQLVMNHVQVIEERMQLIGKSDDFRSSNGEMLPDSLITRLQALSENIKKIQKLEPGFFEIKLKLDVNPIVPFRDLISHHYEAINHEIIYAICTTEVPLLKKALNNLEN